MDLRRHRRIPVRFQSALSDPNRAEWVGTVVNLSKGGCLIETEAKVFAGMNVSLRFDIPGETAPILVVRAAVRWRRKNLVGVGFLSMESPHQAHLDKVLERLKQTG